MPLDYRYDAALKAIVTTVTGTLEEDEVLTHLRKLRDDESVPPGCIEIVDFSSADDFAIKVSGAGRIAFLVPELQERRDYRGTTFFAPSDLAFGIARVFQTMLEQLGIETEIFREWHELEVAVTKRLDQEATQ
jgi:hypothetical protein